MKKFFNQENLINRFFFAILVYATGIFGIHKFVKGKKGMGVLYLFTLGLFGLGWIVDTILAVVNIFKPLNYFDYYESVDVSNKKISNKLVLDQNNMNIQPAMKLSIDYSNASLVNELRIIHESTNLIDNSKNIDTVISRLEFIPEHISYLKQLEQLGLYNTIPTANDYYTEYVVLKDKKIQQAIVRCYKQVLDDASELKTEKARLNRENKYFDKLNAYKQKLSPTVQNYIDDFIEFRK